MEAAASTTFAYDAWASQTPLLNWWNEASDITQALAFCKVFLGVQIK